MAVDSLIDDDDAFDVAAMQHLAERLSCSWHMPIVRCLLCERYRPVAAAFASIVVSYFVILISMCWRPWSREYGNDLYTPGNWLILGCKATKRAPPPIEIGRNIPT